MLAWAQEIVGVTQGVVCACRWTPGKGFFVTVRPTEVWPVRQPGEWLASQDSESPGTSP